MAQVAIRKNPAESGDSEAVVCPKCNGTKKDPFYGTPCDICWQSGFILRQRFNDFGVPIRVELRDA